MAEEITEQKLKDMKLDEKITFLSSDIQRVIGGWIYLRGSNGVFVPEPKMSPKQD